jgi:molybdopterin converting factor small subunit
LEIQVITAGALTHSLPAGREVIAGENLTIEDILQALVAKYGRQMAEELLPGGDLREGLALLLNGRNVLSLPEKFQTRLADGDKLLIAIRVAGG